MNPHLQLILHQITTAIESRIVKLEEENKELKETIMSLRYQVNKLIQEKNEKLQ